MQKYETDVHINHELEVFRNTYEAYCQDRFPLLDTSQLTSIDSKVTAAVVVPLYGEAIEDVLNLLVQLASQKNIDTTTLEVLFVINSPNRPHSLEDFKGNEIDYRAHIDQYETSLQLNTALYDFIQKMKTGKDPELELTLEQAEQVQTIRSSQLLFNAYSADLQRLPDEMASLGGARDIGLATLAYRISTGSIESNELLLERIKNFVVIQTDLDGTLGNQFVTKHRNHYIDAQTQAVQGEVDIDSNDPNVRILALQARLKNRVRFHGFKGYSYTTNLGAQNAASGCNLSYRLSAAILVGGVPHDKSLDDWRMVTRLEELHGTYLDNSIVVATSPRHSARAINGFGSNTFEYLRSGRFDASQGEYHDLSHAVLAGHILDSVASWYNNTSIDVDELLASIEMQIFDVGISDLFSRNVGYENVIQRLKKAVGSSTAHSDFLQTEIAIELKKTLFTRSIKPVTYDIFVFNLLSSFKLIDPQLSETVQELVSDFYGNDVPTAVPEEEFNAFMDNLLELI